MGRREEQWREWEVRKGLPQVVRETLKLGCFFHLLTVFPWASYSLSYSLCASSSMAKLCTAVQVALSFCPWRDWQSQVMREGEGSSRDGRAYVQQGQLLLPLAFPHKQQRQRRWTRGRTAQGQPKEPVVRKPKSSGECLETEGWGDAFP